MFINMGVILYQAGIFVIIQILTIAGGRTARNTAIFLISIFTILQVFATWLMILQFITIFISYSVSEGFINDRSRTIEDNNKEINNALRNNYGNSKYGFSILNPILTKSIPAAYTFMNLYVKNNPALTYERIGSRSIEISFSNRYVSSL